MVINGKLLKLKGEVYYEKNLHTIILEWEDWHEVELFYIPPRQKDPGANLLNRKW